MVDDALALSVLQKLRQSGLSIVSSGRGLQLVPDAHIWIDSSYYLARPLTRRRWTERQAMEDAERIVREVQDRLDGRMQSEVA